MLVKLCFICLLLLLLLDRYKNIASIGTQTVQLSKDVAKLNKSIEATAQLDAELSSGSDVEPMTEQQLKDIEVQKAWESQYQQQYERQGNIMVLKSKNTVLAVSDEDLECKSWRNSHLLEPSERKAKYIQLNCPKKAKH